MYILYLKLLHVNVATWMCVCVLGGGGVFEYDMGNGLPDNNTFK